MATRGKAETEQLIANCEDQLNRLLSQLEDLEDMKADLDEDEYNETKQETITQLKEFQTTLNKMMKGDMSLVDKLGAMQLAIQAAVSNAFQTPEVIKLFAKKQPGQLRQRLEDLKASVKLGRISRDDMLQQAVEILAALKKLGEQLSPQEESFLQEHMSKIMKDFDQAGSDMGAGSAATMLSIAGSQVQRASNQ